MPSLATRDSQGDVPPATAGHNLASTNGVKEYVARIERLHGDLRSQQGEYMRECRTIRADMKTIYDEAKAAGIPKKELKAVVKARDLERRAAGIREDLEGDEQDTFDRIRLALGDLADTPLGQAALDQVGQ